MLKLTTNNNILAATDPIPLPAPIEGEISASVTLITLLCDYLEVNPIEITEAEKQILVALLFAQLVEITQAQALVDSLIEAV